MSANDDEGDNPVCGRLCSVVMPRGKSSSPRLQPYGDPEHSALTQPMIDSPIAGSLGSSFGVVSASASPDMPRISHGHCNAENEGREGEQWFPNDGWMPASAGTAGKGWMIFVPKHGRTKLGSKRGRGARGEARNALGDLRVREEIHPRSI